MRPNSSRTELRKKLAATTGSWDRLPILIELSKAYHRNNPTNGHRAAQEALLLAEHLNDPYWIACSHYAIGRNLIGLDQCSKSLFHLEHSIELFRSLNNRAMLAEANHFRGVLYCHTGKMTETLTIGSENLEFFAHNEDFYAIALTMQLVGRVYRATGQLEEALYQWRASYTLVKRYDFHDLLGSTYLGLATIYREMGDFMLAKKLLFKSYPLLKEGNDRFTYAAALGNLCRFFTMTGNFTKALQFGTKSRAIFHRLQSPANEANEIGALSSLYLSVGNAQKALELEQEAVDLIEQTDNALWQLYVQMNIGLRCLHQKKYSEALAPLDRALDICRQNDQVFLEWRICQFISGAFEGTGNSEKALEFYKLSGQKREELIGIEKQQIFKRNAIKRTTKRIRRTIRKQQQQISSLIEENRKKDEKLMALALQLIQNNERLTKHAMMDRTSPTPAANHWDVFAEQFYSVHHEFYARLMHICPNLTITESKICSLIRVGLSSKEIADLLSVSKRTVDSHRERIRKKLQLPPRATLAKYIHDM